MASCSECSPIVFPLKDQHLLLSHLQRILEEMCELSGARHEQCRSFMDKRGWTEPKSLELHSWCRAILDCPDELSPVLAGVREEERRDILTTCINIRHSAVHRRPQDTETILRSLEAGIGLATMHEDTAIVNHIQNLRTTFQAIIKDATAEIEACSREAGTRLTDCVNSMSEKLASAADFIPDIDDFSETDIEEHLLEAERTGVVPFEDLPG
jgi:hypothetical protein